MAIKLWLHPERGGLFALNPEDEEAIAALGARDVEVTIKADNIRSQHEHRMFFGLISAAFKRWPPEHRFRPFNADHLRHWLVCEAGHCTTIVYMVAGDGGKVARIGHNGGPRLQYDQDAEIIVAASMGELAVKVQETSIRKRTPIIDHDDRCIRVRLSNSIAWTNLGQKRFHQYVEEVIDILTVELGFNAEELIRTEGYESNVEFSSGGHRDDRTGQHQRQDR